MGRTAPSPTFPSQGRIVSPATGITSQDTQDAETDDAGKYFEQLMKIRSGGGQAMSAYRQALQEQPQLADYKPGWGTRIASGLAGFSTGLKDAGAGVQTALDINRTPYMTALGQYSQKMEGLGKLADLESQDEDQQAKDLMNAYGMRMKYSDYLLKKAKQEHDIKVGDVKTQNETKTADAAMIRAKAYADSQNDPNYEFMPQQDGSVMRVDKKSKTMDIIPAHDVRAFVAQSGRISANAAASQAATSAAELPIKRMNAMTAADRANRPLGLGSTIRPQSATDQTRAMDLALRQMYMDPTWRKFIVEDKGIFDAGDPGDFDASDWQDFQEALADRIAQINKGSR